MSAEKKQFKSKKQDNVWPYTAVNAYLALASLVTLAAGYVALSVKPYNSPVSLNVAPVLLVIGYCILVPATIIYHKRDPKPVDQQLHPREAPKAG